MTYWEIWTEREQGMQYLYLIRQLSEQRHTIFKFIQFVLLKTIPSQTYHSLMCIFSITQQKIHENAEVRDEKFK
jgi:hypothetical protein